MKKIITIIKNYLPDILIVLGLWIFSFNILRPKSQSLLPSLGKISHDYTNLKVFGILLVVVGIDILIRRYLKVRK
jgi:hypothetical protein